MGGVNKAQKVESFFYGRQDLGSFPLTDRELYVASQLASGRTIDQISASGEVWSVQSKRVGSVGPAHILNIASKAMNKISARE